MDAKTLRTLNKYQNFLKNRFLTTKKTIEISLETIEIVNNLYKSEYKHLEKRKIFRFFYPLEMLVDVAENIEAKSKVLKSNYLIRSFQISNYLSIRLSNYLCIHLCINVFIYKLAHLFIVTCKQGSICWQFLPQYLSEHWH